MTADELWKHGPHEHTELVEGVLVAHEPAGAYHGKTGGDVLYRIRQYLERNPIGVVVTAETGFVLSRNPDTVRGPDCAVILHRRMPPGGLPESFFDGPPDLAVEVVSPSDRWPEIERKVREYLAAGTALVWVLERASRRAHVFEPGGARVLAGHDVLGGGAVLPGFAVAVDALFE